MVINSCEPADTYFTDLTFANNSNDTIRVVEWGLPNDSTLLLPHDVSKIDRNIFKEVKPDSFCIIQIPMPGEYVPDNYSYQILLWRKSILSKYTEQEIFEKDIFDKRYVFTYNELKAMAFRIVYNGDEEIKH